MPVFLCYHLPIVKAGGTKNPAYAGLFAVSRTITPRTGRGREAWSGRTVLQRASSWLKDSVVPSVTLSVKPIRQLGGDTSMLLAAKGSHLVRQAEGLPVGGSPGPLGRGAAFVSPVRILHGRAPHPVLPLDADIEDNTPYFDL